MHLPAGTRPALPEGHPRELAAFGDPGNATGMKGSSSEDHQLLPELPRLSFPQGGGNREAGKSDFFITCIVLAFLQKTI